MYNTPINNLNIALSSFLITTINSITIFIPGGTDLVPQWLLRINVQLETIIETNYLKAYVN